MAQNAFFFDGTRCTGCKTCVFACKDKYDLEVGTAFRRVYEYTGGQTTVDENGAYETSCYSYYVSLACNFCNNPACIEVCPTGAMHKVEETGLVLVDTTKCIGCGYCHMACPYNVPKVDRQKGFSVKCDGCADFVAVGKKPACVMACPALALQFGPMEEMSLQGDRAAIAPLPEPHYTNPNFYIQPSRDAQPSGSSDGRIDNPMEVQ